jgi:hypothetical protein
MVLVSSCSTVVYKPSVFRSNNLTCPLDSHLYSPVRQLLSCLVQRHNGLERSTVVLSSRRVTCLRVRLDSLS